MSSLNKGVGRFAVLLVPRRRLLAALAVPPLVTMLSLLSTGIANAEPVYFNGPDLAFGGPYVVHTQATADVTCYAYAHQLHVYASALTIRAKRPRNRRSCM